MATGKVKWFNNAKGYGFILPDEGGEDLFAHYSSIQMEGYKTLKAGQPVSFNVIEGPKGNHAVDIDYVEGQAPADTADGTADGSMDPLGEELHSLPQDMPESLGS
ncbi:MAG: cold shock domain-containing protein CspD [Pseudomonadales bacterium]